jgi:hypothetical protein
MKLRHRSVDLLRHLRNGGLHGLLRKNNFRIG